MPDLLDVISQTPAATADTSILTVAPPLDATALHVDEAPPGARRGARERRPPPLGHVPSSPPQRQAKRRNMGAVTSAAGANAQTANSVLVDGAPQGGAADEAMALDSGNLGLSPAMGDPTEPGSTGEGSVPAQRGQGRGSGAGPVTKSSKGRGAVATVNKAQQPKGQRKPKGQSKVDQGQGAEAGPSSKGQKKRGLAVTEPAGDAEGEEGEEGGEPVGKKRKKAKVQVKVAGDVEGEECEEGGEPGGKKRKKAVVAAKVAAETEEQAKARKEALRKQLVAMEQEAMARVMPQELAEQRSRLLQMDFVRLQQDKDPVKVQAAVQAIEDCKKVFWDIFKVAAVNEQARVEGIKKKREAAAASKDAPEAEATAKGGKKKAQKAAAVSKEAAEVGAKAKGGKKTAQKAAAASKNAEGTKAKAKGGKNAQKAAAASKDGEEEDGGKAPSARPDYVTAQTMKREQKSINREKYIGYVPGLRCNDRFFARAEMNCLGMHHQLLAGIDYITENDALRMSGKVMDRAVAVAIVVAGGYQDDVHCDDLMVYTGQGGNDMLGNKKQVKDQKLERGNLALAGNVQLQLPVRVFVKNPDPSAIYKDVYIFDGLYDVLHYWQENGAEGFSVFRYLLRRQATQPPSICKEVGFGSATSAAKNTAAVLQARESGLVCQDLSNGKEIIPVCVVNEVDSDLPPGLDPVKDKKRLNNPAKHFTPAPYKLNYVTEMQFISVPRPIPTRLPKPGQDPHDFVKKLNNNHLPYQSLKSGSSMLPYLRPVVYECGPWCGCSLGKKCDQAQSQQGLQFRMEVFKTPDRGWAVRTWDSIPVNSLVAVFWGEVKRWTDVAHDDYDDTYIFELGPRSDMDDMGIFLSDAERERRRAQEPEFVVDAKHHGSFTRFINHSCNPNLFVQPICAGHSDTRMPIIGFFALKNIPAWAELSYDYGSQYVKTNLGGQCMCGAAICSWTNKAPKAKAGTAAKRVKARLGV